MVKRIILRKILTNRPLLSCHKPLFQSEAECEAVDTKIFVYPLSNKNHLLRKVLHLASF